VTVPRRATRRIVTALRPARRGHLGLHHRGQHPQPGANREGHQPLTNQLTQRHAHLLRHGGRARLGLVFWYFCSTPVPFLGSFLVGRPNTYRTADLRRGTAA
jgi:hypothetical protein